MRAARHIFAASLLSLGLGSGLAAATTPAAALDPTFGVNGFAAMPSSFAPSALQPDGKLLGFSSDGVTLRVERYDLTAALDTTFGTGGFVRLTANGSTLTPAGGLLVVPDGRFYVPARADDPCKVNAACDAFVVGRFLADGQIDTTFGNAGYAPLVVSQLKPDRGASAVLALDADGTLVAVETAYFSGSLAIPVRVQSAMERLSAAGAPLASRQIPVGCGSGGVADVQIQGGGGIIVTGTTVVGALSSPPCVIRFARDLSVDTTFGNAGTVVLSPVTGRGALSTSGTFISSSGNIVGGTWGYSPTINDTFGTLTGLTANGQTNTAYGVPNGSGYAPANASWLAQSCGGKLVGAIRSGIRTGNPAMLLTRYNSNGSVDGTFSGTEDGAIATPVIRLFSVGQVFVRSDGVILVFGSREIGTPPNTSYANYVAAYKQADCLHPTDASMQTVVEYYNAGLDHYFVTIATADMNALDSGHFVGWQRTGYTFSSATTLTNPVCRFYIPPPYGDSHFFSASAVECAEVQSKFQAFVYETSDALRENLPDAITGVCAAPATVAVYRVWDKRADTNHRYTTSREVRDAMLAKGWIPEGYGPDAVAMCAMPQ